MSRCFPFPPPGYTRNSDALIESIKLRNEVKKAKKDRKKEKRREKKDKESKKEKKKDRKGKEGKESKLIELEKKIGYVQKGAYNEFEQLEKSDITVEHSQPVTTPDPCCSDSTQSSNKRKCSTSPSMHNHGTVKKVRFSLRKHAEPGESKLDDQLVSTSRSIGTYGGDDLLPQVDRDQCPGNCEPKHYNELKSLPVGAALNTNLLDDEGMRMVSKYNSLFQNWVPLPPACDGFRSEEDLDWLFSSKQQKERPVSKSVKAVTSALNCSSTSLWPRAQYLPEVELYALPYAIPF
ncbi:hypothetical protein TanjilG_12341 [Lupinus angustifolius]|uniref:Uncharacterized protein n=1 Tax=Lupinus angustifolius TaxID=3871 RepID=A0A4P1QYR6_LUPAN|nr:PREDICTED: uncharacterized protein LOC109326068 [Lupinus angustifolius]OIV97584.1 hypothetical protein TanjilG_12341 [Lupinus angustifolius]